MRDMLELLGIPYAIENVVGSRDDMSPNAISVWGQLFGRHQDRERLLDSGAGLRLTHSTQLEASGLALRRGSCLGRRRRFPRRDPFGRNIDPNGTRACCDGNLFATQGKYCHFGTTRDHSESMGLDPGHMSYPELSQAVLPEYAMFALCQAVMHQLRSRYGFGILTFDDMRADPDVARRAMRHWLRGAGGTSPDQGVAFVQRNEGSTPAPHVDAVALSQASEIWEPRRDEPRRAVFESQDLSSASGSSHDWSLCENEFRELDYTHAGGYDHTIIHAEAPNWSARLRPCWRLDVSSLAECMTSDRNTFIHQPGQGEPALVSRLCKLATAQVWGRITIIVDRRHVGRLEAAGF